MNQTELLEIIELSQNELAKILQSAFTEKPMTLEQYHSYLNIQYHLTKGVHQYFFQVAAWNKFSKQREVRNFFCNFACEEELHYLLAAKDLENLGLQPKTEPLEVTLWHAYFEKTTKLKPMERVGAACVLENISAGNARPWVKKALQASFLNTLNTRQQNGLYAPVL